MTKNVRKCEKEIENAIYKIAKKYGYKELATTGTIDPAYYKGHEKIPMPGLSVLFYNSKIK